MQLATTQDKPQLETDHKIARFKAKHGASDSDVAGMLGISAREVRKNLDQDSFSLIQIDSMHKVEMVIERTISEANLLQDHAPFLEVLKHKNERLEHTIKCLEGSLEKYSREMQRIKSMNWIERLKFLMNPKIISKEMFHVEPIPRED